MEQKDYRIIKRSILASIILVPAIPFILILGIGYYFFITSLETNTISNMKRIVSDHSHMIDSFLSERKADIQFILDSYTFNELSRPEYLEKIFKKLQAKSNAFVDLGVFNEAGVHIAYQGPYKLTGKIYKDAEWFREVMENGYYISDIFLGFRRIPHYIIAIAKDDKDGKWIIRATIDTYLFNNLVKKVFIGKTGEAYILNSSGVFQTERRSGGNLMDKDMDCPKCSSLHAGIKTFIKKGEKRVKYLYAITWLKEKKWLLVVRQEKTDAFKSLITAVYLIILIMVIGESVIIGIAFYLTSRIVKRMKMMDSEKDNLNQQLIRASGLAELGEMSAGFAHEINNPLQIMKSEQTLIKTILNELKENGELKESVELSDLESSVDQINLQIDRCAKITRAILKFGRESEPVVKILDLGRFIPDILSIVEKKASISGIEIKQEFKDTPAILGDPAQMQQILLNLFNNAIDAIIEKYGSVEGELFIGLNPKDEKWIEIIIKDNGCGISTENLKKIFRPFYTTKPVGKGTGLGLSVCYGIIKDMGGILEVHSEKNIGTVFTIILPVAT